MKSIGARNKIRLSKMEFHRGIKVYVLSEDESMIATLPTLVEIEPHAVVEPTMTFSMEEAQQIMDELWQCGLRPTEGTGSAGSLAATERHLQDMRDIAFGALKQKGMV